MFSVGEYGVSLILVAHKSVWTLFAELSLYSAVLRTTDSCISHSWIRKCWELLP